MDAYSEMLGCIFGYRIRRTCWRVGNLSGKYHSLFKAWWDHFGLDGIVFIVGEEGEYAEAVRSKLMMEYPKIEKVISISLENADINCDIQRDIPTSIRGDWLMCQAVLEHVAAPFLAVRNTMNILKVGGIGFFHCAGIRERYHAYPIDCCRFFRDAFFEWERLAENIILVDLLVTVRHCFAAYKRIS